MSSTLDSIEKQENRRNSTFEMRRSIDRQIKNRSSTLFNDEKDFSRLNSSTNDDEPNLAFDRENSFKTRPEFSNSQQRAGSCLLNVQSQINNVLFATLMKKRWREILAQAQTIALHQQIALNSLSKLNNRPSVRSSRHRLNENLSPIYQQVQEIERGTSLDAAIQLKNAIDIVHGNDVSPLTRLSQKT